jgi:NAD(P)-dependent dehydrogenase (short-subunit alcohol dehydrogenase family)
MRDLRGRTAILTGASGGLGSFIAPALARAGMNLTLVAFHGIGLEDLRAAAVKDGVRAISLDLDLRDPGLRREVIAATLREFGGIDVLVNNAGVEISAAYHELSEADIRNILAVNLEAPMMLTRAVLPEMLRQRRGHIVNMSSLAGKFGPGFQEVYSASKAALTAFTYSLRGTYRGTGVSASVVSPSFAEAGIYSRIKASIGRPAPGLLGASVCSPERVARAVVRVIRHDWPEVFVSGIPVRPFLALFPLSPFLAAWVTDKVFGAHDFFRSVAETHPPRPEIGSRAMESRQP